MNSGRLVLLVLLVLPVCAILALAWTFGTGSTTA